jgi:septal ring factor EnvC (AmiA/AmiB activator)
MTQTAATIVAVIISSGASLLISILTIISQSRKQAAEMDKKIAVIETKMDRMKEDIAAHNRYAQMFSENIPAIRQHMTDTDHRLDNIERRLA